MRQGSRAALCDTGKYVAVAVYRWEAEIQIKT